MVDWMPGNVGLGTFVDEDKDDHEMLDFALTNVSTHNVLNMLNDCTKCWHLAFCNELPDVVTCFLA